MIYPRIWSTPGRIQTHDPRIRNPLLYSLSYEGGSTSEIVEGATTLPPPPESVLDMRDSNPQPSVFKQTLYPIELIVFGEFYSDQHGG